MVKALPSHSNCSPFGPDKVVRCFSHGLPAALKNSSTELNPNRKFYCCSIPQDDCRRCKFFYWQDELFPDLGQEVLDDMDETQKQASQSPSMPIKTTRAEHDDGGSPLTPSQKRLRIIQQTLSQVQGPSPPTSPDTRQQHSPAGSSSLEPPITPVRRSRSAQKSGQILSSGTLGKDWVAIEVLTPPPTDPTRSQDCSGSSYSRMSSATLAAQSPLWDRKGKGPAHRHDIFSSPEMSDSYDTSKVSRKLDFGQLPHIPSDEEAVAVAELIECAHIFNPRIQALLHDLPNKMEEFRRSERKRVAAEKSSEIKTKRIAALDQEVRELRARLEELEKQLHKR